MLSYMYVKIYGQVLRLVIFDEGQQKYLRKMSLPKIQNIRISETSEFQAPSWRHFLCFVAPWQTT